MSDEESELLTQNEALDRPLALTFLFLQDSHFKNFGALRAGWQASRRKVWGA
jgi:hypothetical protein